MNVFGIVGIVSGIVQIIGYVAYYRHAVRGDIHPNAASWLIWFYGNVVICISYFSIGDFAWEGVLPIACALANIWIVIALWSKGFFGKIGRSEWVFVSIDVSIVVLWILLEYTGIRGLFGSLARIPVAVFIHLLLLASAVVSFVPLIKETASERSAEHHVPWIIWSCAYALWLIAELSLGMSWQLVYPIVYLILHACVATLVVLNNARSKSAC